MRKQKQNQKLKAFIEKLKANGANINEAFIEVSEYIPEYFLDKAIKEIEKVYKKDDYPIEL